MFLTQDGIRAIRQHEGLRLKAYPDPGSKDGHPWTIGYGHTSFAGPPDVYKGMEITREEAEEIFRRDIGKFSEQVRKHIKTDLNPNQFSAFVSFAYNVGIAGFAKSSALRCANAGRHDLVPSRLALWNKNDGKVMQGLVNRRAKEGALYARPWRGEDDEMPRADEMTSSANQGAEQVQGKPPMQSTTIWAQIGQWLSAGGVGVLAALEKISMEKAVIFGALCLIALGAYVILERMRHARENGI